MTVYTSAYAISDGEIREWMIDLTALEFSNCRKSERIPHCHDKWGVTVPRRNLFVTREEAVADARDKIQKRINSLRDQIQQLEGISCSKEFSL